MWAPFGVTVVRCFACLLRRIPGHLMCPVVCCPPPLLRVPIHGPPASAPAPPPVICSLRYYSRCVVPSFFLPGVTVLLAPLECHPSDLRFRAVSVSGPVLVPSGAPVFVLISPFVLSLPFPPSGFLPPPIFRVFPLHFVPIYAVSPVFPVFSEWPRRLVIRSPFYALTGPSAFLALYVFTSPPSHFVLLYSGKRGTFCRLFLLTLPAQAFWFFLPIFSTFFFCLSYHGKFFPGFPVEAVHEGCFPFPLTTYTLLCCVQVLVFYVFNHHFFFAIGCFPR